MEFSRYAGLKPSWIVRYLSTFLTTWFSHMPSDNDLRLTSKCAKQYNHFLRVSEKKIKTISLNFGKRHKVPRIQCRRRLAIGQNVVFKDAMRPLIKRKVMKQHTKINYFVFLIFFINFC